MYFTEPVSLGEITFYSTLQCSADMTKLAISNTNAFGTEMTWKIPDELDKKMFDLNNKSLSKFRQDSRKENMSQKLRIKNLAKYGYLDLS